MKRTRLGMGVQGSLPTYTQTLPGLPLLCEDPAIITHQVKDFIKRFNYDKADIRR